jgi:NAD(P)-dependent dehydrogenase (short-subunit alcohol dehydrogenase family)
MTSTHLSPLKTESSHVATNDHRLRLLGTRVFITGASRGIGREIALAMAQEGAVLTLAATKADLLEEVKEACMQRTQSQHRTQVLDVTNRDACIAAIKAAEIEHGRIDVLINCAGIYKAASFLDTTPADYLHLLDVNLFGTIHLSQAALPGMVARGSGRIINVASAAGKWASPNQSAYNVSKHAVIGLTRCVAQEVGRNGVTVNAICPGLVETEMLTDNYRRTEETQHADLSDLIAPVLSRVAMGRVLQTREIASLAVFLASAESSGMTGQSLLVDGGMLYI